MVGKARKKMSNQINKKQRLVFSVAIESPNLT